MTESNTKASGRAVMTFIPKMAIEHGATVRLSLVRDHRNIPRWAVVAGILTHSGPISIPGDNFNIFIRVTTFKMTRLTIVSKQIRLGTNSYNTN